MRFRGVSPGISADTAELTIKGLLDSFMFVDDMCLRLDMIGHCGGDSGRCRIKSLCAEDADRGRRSGLINRRASIDWIARGIDHERHDCRSP